MKYQEGDIWVLNDGKEYMIVKKLDLGVHHYAMLLTTEDPIVMKLGSMSMEDGKMTFKTTSTKEQAMYILEAMIHQ